MLLNGENNQEHKKRTHITTSDVWDSELNSSLDTLSFKRGGSQSPESHKNNKFISPPEDAGVEQSSESFTPLATSSSLEQLEQFLTTRTESSSKKHSTTKDGRNQKEKMMLFVCPFNCGDEPKTLASLKCHVQLQHSGRSPKGEISASDENNIVLLLCPFECGVESFKTQKDQREHLMKEHSCTDSLTNCRKFVYKRC